MEFFFPEYRLSLFDAGPSSPNKTGALFAILFIAAWWPAFRFRWGYWLGLLPAFFAAVFMLQTESRGALVACTGGVTCLCLFRLILRPLPDFKKDWRRVVVTCGLFILLFMYSQQLGVNDRMGALSAGDESANVRIQLYTAGMKMIAAAPFGWGAGQAGNAYGQWYQEIGDDRSYLSLVNSHLTWMAEFGIVFQLCYVSLWALVFLLSWPNFKSSAATVCFACWVTLALAGMFSSVLSLLWLWLLPVALGLFTLIQRIYLNDWPSRLMWSVYCAAALGGVSLLQVAAYWMACDDGIHVTAGRIELGERPEAVLIVDADRAVLGDKYGHALRESLGSVEGYTIIESANSPLKSELDRYECVIFSGALPAVDLERFTGSIVLLNPSGDIDDKLLAKLSEYEVTIVIGRLGNWQRWNTWSTLPNQYPNWRLVELRGVRDYIPGWTRFIELN